MSLVSTLVTRLRTGRPPGPSTPNPTAPPPVSTGDGGAPAGWSYGEGEDPAVLQGRYEFTRTFSDLAKGKRNWQLAAFAALGLLALALTGLVGLALQSRTVPYVVEVDRLGRVEAVAPAEAVPSAADRVVVSDVSRFIANIRTVYADPVAQRDAVFRAYAYVAGDARTFLEDYFSAPENDPRLLAAELRRSVDVVSVLPVPVPDGSASRTYRARWNEHEVSGRSGTRDRVWEGYFSVEVQPPTSTEGIERNPLGVFITDVSWSALAGELPPGSASRGPAPTVPDAPSDTVGTGTPARRPPPD